MEVDLHVVWYTRCKIFHKLAFKTLQVVKLVFSFGAKGKV